MTNQLVNDTSPGIIGTAWTGTHTVLLTCDITQNRVLALFKSHHAPMEPITASCAETLSTLLSIGYTIHHAVPLSHGHVQYVLIKR